MVMADRIVILDAGAIAQQGAPEEAYRRPNSPFVASFLGADNVIEGEVRSGDGGKAMVLADGLRLALPQQDAGDGRSVIHFRSDAVTIGDAPAQPGLTLPGRIAQVSYPGGRWRYAIETAAGVFLVDGDRRARPGDAVRLTIPASEMFVFASPASR